MREELRMRSMILGGLPDRCQRHAAATFLVVFAALLAVSTAAQAQTVFLVENLAPLRSGFGTSRAAQQFTTGTHVGGYTIRNVRLHLGPLNGETRVEVNIRENLPVAGSFDVPGQSVAGLENPQNLVENRGNTFLAPNDTTLDGNTKYWITVNDGRAFGSRASYGVTNSDAETSEDRGGGWSIANSHLSRNTRTNPYSRQDSSLTIQIAGFANAGLCDRTPQVQNALLALIRGKSRCHEVTDANLARISSTLSLVDEGITALKARDFAGLSSLEVLELGNNMLTELPDGVFDELTALEVLKLSDNALGTLSGDVFDELTALKSLWLDGNALIKLPGDLFDELTALESLWLDGNALTKLPDDGVLFDELTALESLYLGDNALSTLRDDVFDELSSLEVLYLDNNLLDELPDGVFESLTSLVDLRLSGNPGANFRPVAVALPDDGTVSSGGMVTLDGSGSGGAWGTNVTYFWALTSPSSGVTVSFDDYSTLDNSTANPSASGSSPSTSFSTITSATPRVTIPALAADTELTFTLTVTGRGGPALGPVAGNAALALALANSVGIDTATDTATVMVNVTNDATLSDLALEDGDGNAIALSQPFAPDRAFYRASVAYLIDAVTLTAVKNDSNAMVVITNDDDTTTPGEAELDLMLGSNTLTVTVRAENGSTTKPYRVSVTRPLFPGICGRTPAVRDALMARISVITDCAYVTDVHLATITGHLNLGDQSIAALAVGDFAGLTALTSLDLDDNELATLPDGVFVGLTSLTTLRVTDNELTTLPAGVFDSLTALKILRLSDNHLIELSAGVFDNLTALATLTLGDNALDMLPDDVFEPLTLLTDLRLSGNPGGLFRPAAVALSDGGTVSSGGGTTVTLDGSGSGSGGAWGTNVTYSWALTTPAGVVGVLFDDDTSVTTAVTIPALVADTELTFTLTVTGRGGTDGIVPGTDTATVVTASADATLESLTVNDGTNDLPLAPAFASGTHVYTAQVGKAVTMVTLTAMTTDSDATVTAVALDGTGIADVDFTDGIEVPSLLAGENEIVVTVRAEDTSTTQTYTVTVTREANTAPTALNSSVTTDEDTAHTFATTQFSFADGDGDALVRVTVVTVVTPPAAGALALGGAAVTADQAVSAADIGQLVFTPASNAHGQDYASFTFKVSDGIDESDSAYTMTVHVTAVNDAATGAPEISVVRSRVERQGTAQVGEQLTAGQGDIDDIDGLPTAFPGDYSFQWVRVDADGISNPTDISGETGSTYTPADADVGKKLQVKVSFTDDDNSAEELTSEAYPASGTVEAAPVFTTSATFDVAENQTAVGTVQATDADGDVTRYTIEGGADLALFMIDPTSGELSFNTAPNHEAAASADGSNTYVVDVHATSGVGIREKTTDQTITVTVTDVDEPPGAPFAPTVSSASVVSVTATWVAPSNAGPAIEDYDYRSRVKDPEGSWVEVTNTTSTALTVTIDGLDENTEYEVAVRATNEEGMGQWSAPGSGSTDANASPAFSSSATFNVAENQTAVGTVQATDADDDDDVTGYTIEGGADLALFVIGPTSGELAFRAAPNHEAAADADGNNTYVVDVRATSGAGIRTKTTDQTITVTVTDVDEPPGAPFAPTVESASVVSVTATWVAPSNAGPAIEDYDYRSRVKDPVGSWVEVTDTTSTALSATIDGLAENTAYDVQVRATNDEGMSGWSEAGSGSTDAANAKPVFTTLETFDVAENQTAVGMVQATDADADDDVTGYTIEGGADLALFVIDLKSGVLAFNTAPNHEAAADADDNNTYEVDVRATSGAGIRTKTTDQTITVTVTDVDEPPSAPDAPRVSSASVVSVTATWVAPSNAGPAIEDYDYRYRVSATQGSRVKDPEGSRVKDPGVPGEGPGGVPGEGPGGVPGEGPGGLVDRGEEHDDHRVERDDRWACRKHRVRRPGAGGQRRGHRSMVRGGQRIDGRQRADADRRGGAGDGDRGRAGALQHRDVEADDGGRCRGGLPLRGRFPAPRSVEHHHGDQLARAQTVLGVRARDAGRCRGRGRRLVHGRASAGRGLHAGRAVVGDGDDSRQRTRQRSGGVAAADIGRQRQGPGGSGRGARLQGDARPGVAGDGDGGLGDARRPREGRAGLRGGLGDAGVRPRRDGEDGQRRRARRRPRRGTGGDVAVSVE